MNSSRLIAACICCSVLSLGLHSARAALPKETRSQLNDIKKDLGAVTKLVRDKAYDEAQKLIDDAAAKIDEIARNAGPDDSKDRTLVGVKNYLLEQKGRLLAAKGVSFAAQVAPIFNSKCMGCHKDNPKAGLNLSTYAGMKRGGQSGPLLVPGNPRRSLLMVKLTVPNAKLRMPKGAAALDPEELMIVSTWIAGGAKFDGERESDLLSDLIRNKKRPKVANVKIPKPTGKETVSFTRDIAPFMSRLCVRCHSGNNPRGGLSLETFEKMMQGGDSGRVIIPGNREGSRLFRLVGGLENPRMPQGQARITRKNYEDLKTWFDEGNKFDGDNAQARLRDIVPTQTELEIERLAKLTPKEWEQMRLTSTEELWTRTLPKVNANHIEGDEFLVWGNVSDERLNEINKMAVDDLAELKAMFNDKSKDRTFNGRLAVIVFADRLGYEEFHLTIDKRRPEPTMFGHFRVTPSLQDAYIVLQDVGDEPDARTVPFEANLIMQLAGAYLAKRGSKLPAWLVKGTGLYLAARSGRGTEYFKGLHAQAAQAVANLQKPEEVFADGTFSPADTAAVGYGLVTYLVKGGGEKKFDEFINRMGQGGAVDAATRAVYGADAANLAAGYLNGARR